MLLCMRMVIFSPPFCRKTIYCHQPKYDVSVAVILTEHMDFVSMKETTILNKLTIGIIMITKLSYYQ